MSEGPLLISASQVNLVRECERKYGFSYIEGRKTPSTPSQALGTDVDDNYLQPYLRDGKEIDSTKPAAAIAAAGLHLLPTPKFRGLEVQKHFVLPAPRGRKDYAFQGYKDLWLPYRGLPGFTSWEEEQIPIVADFKTTKSFNWQKDEDDLREDVQAQLYATNAMYATGARVVDLVWIYFRTTGKPKAQFTHVRVDGAHVAKQFVEIDKTAQRIVELRKNKTTLKVLDLEPNTNACDNFGGCPYQHLCNLSPSIFETLPGLEDSANMNPETNDLMARLAAMRNGTPLGVNPPEKDTPKVGATVTLKPDGEVQVKTTASAEIVESIPEAAVSVESTQEEAPKRKGRPKGSKNKPKDEVVLPSGALDDKQIAAAFERVSEAAEKASETAIIEEIEAVEQSELAAAFFSLAAKVQAVAAQFVEIGALLKRGSK